MFRLILMSMSTDNVVPIIYWLSVEAPISIVNICLPSIFFLIKRGVQYGPYSLLISKDVSTPSNTISHTWKIVTVPTKGPRDDEEALAGNRIHAMDTSWERLDPRGPDYDAVACKAPSKRSSEQSSPETELALQSIRVRRDVDVKVKQNST